MVALKRQGNYVLNDNRTIQDYFAEWLKIYVKPTLKPRTYESYKTICEEFISYHGNIKLKSLTPLHLLGFYNYLRDRGSNQKQPKSRRRKLTENTVLRYYAVINVALKQAVEWQLVAFNPNERVKRPKKVKVEAKFYDLEQTLELLKALDNESIKYQAIIRLALDSGCRRGELTGLEWEDVDLKNGIIAINKTTHQVNSHVIEDTPKNNSSIRTVYISDPTIEVLKEYKKYQSHIGAILLNKWQGSKKVFTTDEGAPIHPDTPRKIFKRILIKYKLPIINFHALRHTSASLQMSKGIGLADISKRLGHSDVSTTLNIYSHAFNSGSQKIVSEFNTMFNTKKEG